MSMEFRETVNRFWWEHEAEKQLDYVGKEVKPQIFISTQDYS